jgi:hypothetical protein
VPHIRARTLRSPKVEETSNLLCFASIWKSSRFLSRTLLSSRGFCVIYIFEFDLLEAIQMVLPVN